MSMCVSASLIHWMFIVGCSHAARPSSFYVLYFQNLPTRVHGALGFFLIIYDPRSP